MHENVLPSHQRCEHHPDCATQTPVPRHPLERAGIVQVHPEANTKGMPLIVPLVRCIDDVANVLAWDGHWTQGTQIVKTMGYTLYGSGATTNVSRLIISHSRLTSLTLVSRLIVFSRLTLVSLSCHTPTPSDGGFEGILLIVVTCPLRRINARAHIQGPCLIPWHWIVQLLVPFRSHIADRLAPVLQEKLCKWLSTQGEAIAAAIFLAKSSIAKQSLCQCMPQPHLGRPFTLSSPWSTSAALSGMGTAA